MYLCVVETIVGSLLSCGVGTCLSIFCNRSFGDYTNPQHEETTVFPHTSPLHINVMFISGCEHFHHVFRL